MLEIIAWSVIRTVGGIEERESVLIPVMNACNKVEACDAVYDYFQHTDRAKEGWCLIGKPSALTVDQELYDSWRQYVDSTPANEPEMPTHLQPVT